MARPLRVAFPGAVYHITARGNSRQIIFAEASDCRAFMAILNDVKAKYDWEIYAHCLMPNHYHLLLETPEANLSGGMHYLNGTYAQSFNRKHAHAGHVFEGRFKSILVDRDIYALELTRYIALNPVRAGLVTQPSQWEWSSYKATIGRAPRPRFLSVDWVLKQFRAYSDQPRKAYQRYVMAGIKADPPWSELKSGIMLGGEEFVKSVESHFKVKKEAKGVPSREHFVNRLSLDEIFEGKRRRPICVKTVRKAQRDHGYTLKSVAEFLGVTPSAITRALQRLDPEA